ncbi:MAG: flagellar hook assembly protein FlgD [Rhodobacterales bacterium]|nr:flagellar hook assembly protein FlgD [Rhodobacterales bacterium]
MTVTAPTSSLTATTASSASAAASSIASDYETFLVMLTTQLTYQDPLNPMDSSEFAVQLATFSGVEQQAQTNVLLESVLGQLSMMTMAQMAGWVGMEARSAAPVAYDGATPVDLALSPAEGADSATLVVTDAQGGTITREPVPAGATSHIWGGLGSDGLPLPAGTYTLTLENYDGETLISTTAVESYARILEVQSSEAGLVFRLAGGGEVGVAEVTALREGQG